MTAPADFDEDEVAMAVNGIAVAIEHLADGITPLDALPGHDAAGGTVTSLTEAVVGLTAGMFKIAEAIERVAEALENK
jgi:hypothetical protein